MKNDAIALANELIDKSKNSDVGDLTILKLMKLVYIAHGLCLSLLNGRSLLNPRYDWVEAWDLGPVIPSVYHTFKHNGGNKITEHGVILKRGETAEEINCIEPKLEGAEERYVVDITWKLYGRYTANQLVTILHRNGTPWSRVYVKGQNRRIPDSITRSYYDTLVDITLKNARREQADGLR